MGGFASGLDLGAGVAANQVKMAEANRIAGRNSQAALIETALNNPDTSPSDRAALLQQHAALFQPHEAPDLFKRLSGLIHGQQPAAASQPTSSAAPTAPETAGPQVPGAPAEPPKDLLGIPISDPAVASAHAEPMHPMAASHPILDRFREAHEALSNHLKGFAQPVAPDPAKAAADSDVLARSYASPVSTARETASLAAKHAQDLANIRGGYGVEQANIRAGGSSAQARYIRAFANEKGKEPSELNPDEMQQAIREYGEANRRPQTIIDQRNGVANIVTRDADGQAVASPMRDMDGQMFDGFKPDKVSIHNGHYQFVGADNVVHSVPITNVTRTIFGPHVLGEGGEKPLTLHKRDPEAPTTPIASAPSTPSDVTAAAATLATPTQPVSSRAPQVPGAPPAGNGSQRRGAAVKAPAAATPGYAGVSLGAAKLGQQDRATLESDQQVQAAIERVFPTLEKLKDKNSLGDKATSIMDALGYKAGFAPSDAQGEILKDLAFIKAQGALPLMRLGRNRKTVEDIQQHLPSATDTPARLYDNIKWLRDNVIPENVEATKNPTPTGKKQPASGKAPKSPTAGGGTEEYIRDASGKLVPAGGR